MINVMQKCPQCYGQNYRKNGRVKNRQRYLCKDCGRQFLEVKSKTESFAPSVEESQDGISIILLDLENLKLDTSAEDYLQSIASYPIQVKLAFANWSEKAVIKQDIELYERGYFLVHVPGGKNSADARMMTLGAAIRIHYPKVEEVFVCSSDWLLTNLSNELLSQNLRVWRVRRQNKLLEIENRKTGEVYAYSLDLNQEIPDPKELITKLEQLIEQERESVSAKIQELSQLEELLSNRKTFVQKTEKKQESSLSVEEFSPDLETSVNGKVPTSRDQITDSESLKSAIEQIIEEIKNSSRHKKVTASTISNAFKKKFGITVNQILQELDLGKNITDFLASYPQLLKQKNITDGAINKRAKAKSKTTCSKKITNRIELEKVLWEILNIFHRKNGSHSVPITTLGGEFKEYYGKSVSKVMKAIKITGTFTKFLESSNEFKLKKVGKIDHVIIND